MRKYWFLILACVLCLGMCGCSKSCDMHTYTAWEVTKEATCIETGLESRTCTKCDETETKDIEITDHAYNEGEIIRKPSCYKEGAKVQTCEICEHTIEVEIQEAGHRYGNVVVERASTCMSAGASYKQCENCDWIERYETPVTGHTFGEWITQAATCTEDGSRYRQCQTCAQIENDEVGIPAAGHAFGEWITQAATCTEAGSRYRQCQTCGQTENDEFYNASPAGHVYNGISCVNCGSTLQLQICNFGQAYTDRSGLTVTLHSFTVTEEAGYYNYTISYTIKNQIPDSKIMPGSFKLYFADNSGEPQYGMFDYLYYGEEDSRTYSWKVLKSQSVLVLEYNIGLDDTAFFSDAPIEDTLHWWPPVV